MHVERKEGAAMAKREGNKRRQLARSFQVCGKERKKRLEEAEKKAAEKAAEIARLHDPALRLVTFSGLTKLQLEGLKEQLRLRSFVDKRREDNGRALVLVLPTGEGGRGWLVRQLQSLLKKEFKEKKIANDPSDLKEGDLGLESRAPRQIRAQKAAPSDGNEAADPSRNAAKVVSARQYQSPRMRRMTSLERATRWSSCSRARQVHCDRRLQEADRLRLERGHRALPRRVGGVRG